MRRNANIGPIIAPNVSIALWKPKALKNGNEDVEKEKKIFERLKAQGIVKDEMTTKF